MGGGGASQAAALASSVEIPYRAIAFGHFDDTGIDGTPSNWGEDFMNWSGTSYMGNPSMLRWIKEFALSGGAASPYTGLSAYDPSSDITEFETQLDNLQTYLTTMNLSTDLGTFSTASQTSVGALVETVLSAAESRCGSMVQSALASAGTDGLNGAVQAALTAFKARLNTENDLKANSFAAEMSGVNAVNSSAYVLGMALLEAQYLDRVAQYDADFTLTLTKESFNAFVNAFIEQARMHLTAVLNGTQMIFAEQGVRLQTAHSNASLSTEQARIAAVLQQEANDKNLEYDVQDVLWDGNLFQMAANVVSSVNGSVVPNPASPSKGQSAMGGALAGASVGATVGGAPGAAIGAALGGVAGYLSGGK